MRQIKRHEPYCNKIANHIVQVLVVNCLCLLEKGGICILIQQPCSLLLTYNTGLTHLVNKLLLYIVISGAALPLYIIAKLHCSTVHHDIVHGWQHNIIHTCSHLFKTWNNLSQKFERFFLNITKAL